MGREKYDHYLVYFGYQAHTSIGKPEGKYALVWATFKAYKWHVAVGWPFRLAMIALSYSQPFIISRTIRFVTEPVTEASRDVGIQLVVFATVVYIGMAVSTYLPLFLIIR